MPTRLPRGTHVIHTYSVVSNTILCVCGVVVTADNPDGTQHEEWLEHKKWGRENPFKAPKREPLFTKYHRKKNVKIEA